MVSLTQASLMGFLAILTGSSSAAENLRYEPRQLVSTYSAPSQYVYSMLSRVNSERAARGLPALCLSSQLMAAATRQSNDMAFNNFMSHTGSDGSTMASRITATGYKWNALGENIAGGQKDVAAVMVSWMNSSGHRANILGNYTMFGTAYAYNEGSTYKHYWTQDFGKSSSESCNYESAEVPAEVPEAIDVALAINSTDSAVAVDTTPYKAAV